MKNSTEQLREEMDEILLKTLASVQPILENQGEQAARDFIKAIADGIKAQLTDADGSSEYAQDIHQLFIQDLNAALFSTRH
ncbi:MAG: hypothetical protein HQL46_02655 [Gammaproteobacteria bacterium]|nr:hypothetical protein [Gammaproteobacteria bacterium]